MTAAILQPPFDATLSVTKAARLIGVHPNTIRAWSDQGRLRYYRINSRGDRRYRLGDLEQFLSDSRGAAVLPPPTEASFRRREARSEPIFQSRLRVLPAPGSDGLTEEMSVAAKAARDYAQMATWAAQLQSIQQLGNRLNRLRTVRDIGEAIATELRQLIDYHNVRVYRVDDDDLVPIAMLGQVGEYVDETPEQLRIKIGWGITGWVARHGVPQNLPNAAADPRAETIPGTEEDLDESMLLAPMVYDDEVLGVLVLSKLGLSQFTEDDLRLLVIYASFAAVAMANADSTELLAQRSASLERQLRGQRELIQITESILTTLDPSAVLEQITERLGALVRYDNIAIERYDRQADRLEPVTARGVNAAEFLEPWQPGETGIATWVVAHNDPQLVFDERADPRINQFRDGPIDGSVICVPLSGREGVAGVLTLERLGTADRFSEEEFDLVKLFAAQVSIALHNAEIHKDQVIKAQTDGLTGLLNHPTFQEWLVQRVRDGSPFSLIMLDLDDFRTVNNDFGHQAGDRLLRAIADVLVNAGRDSDQVFRYGGDEFAFILPGSDQAGAELVAERALAAVCGVVEPSGESATARARVSASIGVATFPIDGSTSEEILLAADRACYVAKRRGRALIVKAAEGRALAAEITLHEPTPVDAPSIQVG